MQTNLTEELKIQDMEIGYKVLYIEGKPWKKRCLGTKEYGNSEKDEGKNWRKNEKRKKEGEEENEGIQEGRNIYDGSSRVPPSRTSDGRSILHPIILTFTSAIIISFEFP